VTDPWVAILRSVQGNNVERSADAADAYENPIAFHVVICRESAIYGPAEYPSLDGLPDSDEVTHWFDGHHIRTEADLRLRFAQAVAMAVGLNECRW